MCVASNGSFHVVLHAILSIDAFFCMMTGYGVRSAMLVHNTQFRWLVAVNLTGVVIAIGVAVATPVKEALAYRRLRRRRRQKPHEEIAAPSPKNANGDGAQEEGTRHAADENRASSTASNRLQNQDDAYPADHSHGTPAKAAPAFPDRWPTLTTLYALASLPRRREWVDAIREANAFRYKCELCPKELEPIRSLEAFIRNVRFLWAEAKAEDSALEPLLNAALERLVLIHARMLDGIKGRGGGGGLTLALEGALLDEGVMEGMRRRRRAQVRALDASVAWCMEKKDDGGKYRATTAGWKVQHPMYAIPC